MLLRDSVLDFSNLTDFLSEQLNREITQAELARALDLDKSSISLRVKRCSLIKEEHIKKIKEIFGIDINVESMKFDYDKKFITVKYYVDVIGSCAFDSFEKSHNFKKIKIPKYLICKHNANKNYSIITAKGNSMSGAIEDGDKLLIESFNDEQILDNSIYVFCYKEEIFIKRLYKNINQIIVKSDNQDFPTRYIENEDINEIKIIGKVIASVRNYI